MTALITTGRSVLAERLLADRESLSLGRARIILGTRARTLTPLGAREYLGVTLSHGRETYDTRVQVAADVMELYRKFFPEEYASSQSPQFSTQREQEFYRLVHDNLFPLRLSEDVDLWQQISDEPDFFLPFIPVKGIQRHMWAGGCFHFQEIETVFKVAQVLSWMTGTGGRGWEALRHYFGLPKEIEPAPPTGWLGWSIFANSCAVEESPLRFLPLAFHFISYKTDVVWLDLPQVGYMGWDWSEEKIIELRDARLEAQRMIENVASLDKWFDEDPVPRISRAIELWNAGAAIDEAEGGTWGQPCPFGDMRGTALNDFLQRGARRQLA